jgi:hypothetical protein
MCYDRIWASVQAGVSIFVPRIDLRNSNVTTFRFDVESSYHAMISV